MKKVIIVSAVAMLCVGTVFAGTLYVPWFNDNGGAVGPDIIPPDGEATYIRLQNVSGGTLNVTIDFYDTTGLIHTNTATMAAWDLLAWRPSEFQGITPNGGAIPADLASAVISWPGGTNADIVGNMITINANGSRLGVNLVSP